jgi:Ca2+-binding EF-hand superfamily protein
MSTFTSTDIEEVQEVFDLFDFWDGRDSMVDGYKVGDFLRCCGLSPTQAVIMANGGTKCLGEKQYKFEEIMPIYKAISSNADPGTYAEFVEAFKTFDREGQGYINAAELRHVLMSLGERLPDSDVDQIFKLTGTELDLEGNIKYEDFIKKVMAGPSGGKNLHKPSLLH